MELTEKIQVCNSLNDIPDFKVIKSLPKGIRLRVVFGDNMKSDREKLGKQWEFEHPEFQIAIHTIKPEINFVKLITDEEIREHQNFFEKCAKDYRNLAITLINEFANKHNLEINPDSPMDTLYHTNKLGYKPVGEMNEWQYAFHGIHCAFSNLTTGQHVEVPLTYGLEFGQLDPYFFTRFIKSTKEYEPLPIGIYCDYADGNRILEKMVELGKFENINSNWPNEKGIVVADREKVNVNIYKPETEEKRPNITVSLKSRRSTFNKLWSWLTGTS